MAPMKPNWRKAYDEHRAQHPFPPGEEELAKRKMARLKERAENGAFKRSRVIVTNKKYSFVFEERKVECRIKNQGKGQIMLLLCDASDKKTAAVFLIDMPKIGINGGIAGAITKKAVTDSFKEKFVERKVLQAAWDSAGHALKYTKYF